MYGTEHSKTAPLAALVFENPPQKSEKLPVYFYISFF